MNREFLIWKILVILILALCMSAPAQDRDDLKWGVGFQSSFPAWGISGSMDINETITAQAIIGFFSGLKTYAGRGLYRFKKEQYWEIYGYGMLGLWSYDGVRFRSGVGLEDHTETVLGFGAGAGLEYDWRAFNPDLPPLFWNFELGVGFVEFDEVDYDFSALLIGVGVHYRF